MKPFKEPLKPNLNINNHNSISMTRESDFVDTPSNGIPVKAQFNVDTNGSPLPRQSRAIRPTTIRVPSKMPSISDNLQSEPPPPLPFRKPIGSLNTPEDYKQSPKPAMSLQYSMGPEPSLPPRKPTMNKPLPPRPLSGKVGPGRPPPKFGTNRAPSISVQPPPKPQGQKPSKREMVLPPRPRPGHCLYNKYILELPHGIAALDYEGCNIGELSFEKDEVLLLLEQVNNNEFQCQAGEVIGRVHTSHLKIITPLDSYSSPIYDDVPAAPGEKDSYGLKVKAIYDFQPQNSEELSLRAGDVVTEVEQADHQWYRGTCRGSTGFFPISYAEVLSNSSIPEKKQKPPPAPVSGPRCMARFDFEGEHSDELTFFEGDVILLHESAAASKAADKPNVYTGHCCCCCCRCVPAYRLRLPNLLRLSNLKENGLWHCDRILITKQLDEKWSCGKLNGREGMFPSIYVQTTTGEEPSIDPMNEAVGGMRARALYDFNADCDEELFLK
ncbi:hypothetical protein OJAV_G00005150 [Oryzias javanicus]|uniref:SH3 domain-containing protein n=1 Tax=Oryzias javanicus TaxID=123683 RepID=A0A3S2MWG3_ORYJA|nr:hypothetical protein OJAV_G00005150 [Oryzias javanicus]